MGASDNEQIARSYYDCFNRRDFDGARATLADDVVMVVVGSGERYEGPAAVTASDETWAAAFADGRADIDNVITAGDTVVVEFKGRGTHTGSLLTPDGEVPGTGRAVELHFCDILALRDGKIAEVREYYDTLSLMTQLGLLPEPAPAD